MFSPGLSPRFSFSQSDNRTSSFASHATSSSEMGLFIQSPLYLTSANVQLPTLLGLNISSRDCWHCLTPGVTNMGFIIWPPNKQLTWAFRESIHWRLLARLSPEMVCNSDSARNINNCSNRSMILGLDPHEINKMCVCELWRRTGVKGNPLFQGKNTKHYSKENINLK